MPAGLRQPSCGSTPHASSDDKHAMNNCGYQFFANSFRRRVIFFTMSYLVFESEQYSPTGRMICSNWDNLSLDLGLVGGDFGSGDCPILPSVSRDLEGDPGAVRSALPQNAVATLNPARGRIEFLCNFARSKPEQCGFWRPGDCTLKIGSGCAASSVPSQTMATAVSGSPKRAAPRPFRGGAQPEAYWASRRYQDNVGAFRQRQQR
jgi:hypothetical protein